MICPFCKKQCLIGAKSITCNKALCSLFTQDNDYDIRFFYQSTGLFNYSKFLFTINDYVIKVENCNSTLVIRELTTNTRQEISDYPFVEIYNQTTLDNLFSCYNEHCHLFIRSLLF
jgi:hypothetical protein